jgi:hypothetical protein
LCAGKATPFYRIRFLCFGPAAASVPSLISVAAVEFCFDRFPFVLAGRRICFGAGRVLRGFAPLVYGADPR